jgi:hypothetical protein
MGMGADTDTIERQHELGTTAAKLNQPLSRNSSRARSRAPPHSGGAHRILAGAAAACATSLVATLHIARSHRKNDKILYQ